MANLYQQSLTQHPAQVPAISEGTAVEKEPTHERVRRKAADKRRIQALLQRRREAQRRRKAINAAASWKGVRGGRRAAGG